VPLDLGQLRHLGGQAQNRHAMRAVGDTGLDLAADRRAVEPAVTVEEGIKSIG
jgi:hypothetical protein